MALALVAGGPAVLGAWLAPSPSPRPGPAHAFGVAARAVAQVAWAVGRSLVGRGEAVTGAVAGGFVVGVVAMYLTALLTA